MPQSFSALQLAFDPTAQQIRLTSESAAVVQAALSLPCFEIDGREVSRFLLRAQSEPVSLPHGALEVVWTFAAEDLPGVTLDLVWRGFLTSPVLRFKLILRSEQPVRLSKTGGADQLLYFQLTASDLDEADLTEIQLSHFDPVAHSYLPCRLDFTPAEAQTGMSFVGPIAIFHRVSACLLAAYEHGADHPNGFLGFDLEGEGAARCLALRARKGNYAAGQVVDPQHPFDSVWFELALYAGGLDDFLPVYRRFFLEEVCINPQSRQPYIFYNTWNYQERIKYFEGRPYLSEMNAARMLAEIDVAHRMGVDVFVIDTGWYDKTGDWLVNLARFPEGLQEVRRRLEGYGMKLGLWFNPTAAALTSRPYRQHPEWEMTRAGKPLWRGSVWETEESAGMCLASDYAADFVETMVRLNHELGVCYFKWDAIGQYGCDSPLHNHGTVENSPEERADCYAYALGRAMIHVVEEVSRRCPDVIVDFDVTEGGRFVGLGFLSAGKYFLINNGPYFHDFDIPKTVKITPDTINVFFYPGPARSRVCRQGSKYDPFIPSILFLTHYLPDGPQLSQRNSLASLVLGGNGWWGDLLALKEEEVAFLGEQAVLYKRISVAATRAYPRVRGFAGSSPEIHEKIDPAACAGLVAFFTVTPGRVVYTTQPVESSLLMKVVGADDCELTGDGRLRLTVDLAANDARVVYVLPITRDTRLQGAIIKDDHILLIRHQHHADGRTYWLIPGGGAEFGEDDETGVKREMQEETGLEVAVERVLISQPGLRGGVYRWMKTFLCTPLSGEPKPGYEPEEDAAAEYGIVEVGWFDLRAPQLWGDIIHSDPYTYPLLMKLRQVLGYS